MKRGPGSESVPGEHIAKHRKTASGSDFSTYELCRALGTPPPPPAATDITPQTSLVSTSSDALSGHLNHSINDNGSGSKRESKLSLEPPHTPSVPAIAQTAADLSELLDFSKVDTREAITDRFYQLAYNLLHFYRVEIRTATAHEQLELLELEFYLYKSGCHEDPFTHASPEQSQLGRWYFHRPPSRLGEPCAPSSTTAGYRGGTRKGLDITIGQPPPPVMSKYFSQSLSVSGLNQAAGSSSAGNTSVVHGGILLRSARRVSNGKVISGPSLLVDEILRLSRASEILELVTVNWNGNISAFPPGPSSTLPNNPHDNPSTMYLVRAPASSTPSASTSASAAMTQSNPTTDKDTLVRAKRRIFLSPRIGLDISHPAVAACTPSPLAHPRTLYIARPYRFYVCPHLLTANGRGQTFVGVYDAVVEKGRCEDDSELVGEVVKLSGVKGVTAMKYLAEFRKGLDSGASEDGDKETEGGDVEASKELKEWIGPKGKTVTSSVMVWLKMIGTLRRVLAASKSAASGLDRAEGPSSAHPSASPLVNARPWT
ncbi:hypothetical protein C8Q74DRAFT_290534 [Fomes fomentarius]|nr:hypothetical protein C8Q74DRAFT_290534 [Fomes fomentarius]